MASHESSDARKVRDFYGRRYRIGEPARELIGHSRRWQAWCAWACMAAISQLQYAFGMAALGLQATHGWSLLETMWLLALFVAFQAMVAIPVAWMHQHRLSSPAQLVVVGGALTAGGLLTLSHVDGFAAAVIGYALVGGVGAGLVYSTCITTAAKWFPDKRVATMSFVTGGFACGSVPTIALLTIFSSQRGQTVVLDVAALATLVIVTVGFRPAAERSATALVATGH